MGLRHPRNSLEWERCPGKFVFAMATSCPIEFRRKVCPALQRLRNHRKLIPNQARETSRIHEMIEYLQFLVWLSLWIGLQDRWPSYICHTFWPFCLQKDQTQVRRSRILSLKWNRRCKTISSPFYHCLIPNLRPRLETFGWILSRSSLLSES